VKVLLDTHAFLWWTWDDPRLSPRARRTIADPRNDPLLSTVSAWEIMLKAGTKDFRLDDPPERYIPAELRTNGFGALDLSLRHALALADLPTLHQDPFDRLLLAQAISERIPLVSRDRLMARYPVKIIW